MKKVDDQLNAPRLPQRRKFSLDYRVTTWKRKQKKQKKRQKQQMKHSNNDDNNKERIFKFNRPKWSNVKIVTHNVKGCSGK